MNTWTFNPQRTLKEPSSSRAASAAHFPLRSVLVSTKTSTHRFVFGGLTNRRRFASIRSGRHLRRSHPFLSSHWTVTLIVTRRYLKDKFSSSPYSCFVSRFLLRFCFVLRRSLSSSSSQLNNMHSDSSAHTRPSWNLDCLKIHVSISPSQILDVTDVTLNWIRIHFRFASTSSGKACGGGQRQR